MQYAIMKLRDGNGLLLDASELQMFDSEDAANIPVLGIEDEAENSRKAIIYGAIMPRVIPKKQLKRKKKTGEWDAEWVEGIYKEARSRKGFVHTYYSKEKNAFIEVAVEDIARLGEDGEPVYMGYGSLTPVAMLLAVNEHFSTTGKDSDFCRTLSLSYSNLNKPDSILNGKYLCAACKEEKRRPAELGGKEAVITVENWKDFVDIERLERVASKIL